MFKRKFLSYFLIKIKIIIILYLKGGGVREGKKLIYDLKNNIRVVNEPGISEKVREFYLRETKITEVFSRFIQIVNKNLSCQFIYHSCLWISMENLNEF